ncbi:LysR family transcriptional regulator [Actinomadura rifamycini]|uniref:LysR family transcriptional regulator n=1 Tax=Actinomadura rifamycini TaxID=31962 RepID=UPI0006842FB4|nr:LysR family transcriptional regulator [Actinomadura rifamycini]
MVTGGRPSAGLQNAPGAHQLQLFLVLAEELHFRRSAQRVFMSQSAFSQQISALERRLGLDLVERTTRRVALTPAGAALVPYARAVVDATAELQAAVAALDRPPERLVVGAFEAITAVEPVPTMMNELRARHPQVEVEFVRTGFADTVRTLLDGEVDAALLALPVPEGIQTLPLASGPRCAVMAEADPLAGKGPLTVADLADRPFIGFSPDIPKAFRDFWSVDPRPDGSPIRYTSHEVADYESALSAIALGEGIEFVPEVARYLYPRPGVAYVEVTDLEPWTIALAWRPEDRDAPGVAAFRRAARTALEDRASWGG